MERIVAYERVSTARQGASGLGIEAQRHAIEGYADQRDASILARFTEVESGRNPDRPELAKVLHLAKVTGATLVIAKLDRLSRNAAFLLTLRDSGVRFSAVDLPEANDLTVGIMALVAQQEREAISRRTREALAVARARGVSSAIPMALRHSGGLARARLLCTRRSGRTPSATPEAWRTLSRRYASKAIEASDPTARPSSDLPTHAKFTEIRRRPCLRLQPLQPGTPPF
jgi:DNA invertase Pin-like site-specific DNA recombinase